jgi:hypothetical protein
VKAQGFLALIWVLALLRLPPLPVQLPERHLLLVLEHRLRVQKHY